MHRPGLVCAVVVAAVFACGAPASGRTRDLGPATGGVAANGAGELAWGASPGRVRVHTGTRIRTFTVPASCSVTAFAGRRVLLGCNPVGQLLNTSTGRVSDIPHDRRDGTTWWGMGTKWLEGFGGGATCGEQPSCGVRMHRRTGRLETYSSRPDPVTMDVGGPDFDLNTETGEPGPRWRLSYAENGTITAHRAGKRWRVTRRGGAARINNRGVVGLVTASESILSRVFVSDPRHRRFKRVTGLRRRSGERFSIAYPLRRKLVVVVGRFLPGSYSNRLRLIETALPF